MVNTGDTVYIMVRDKPVAHVIQDVQRDGNCLFYTISRIVFGTAEHGLMVRKQVVTHVYENWSEFQVLK